MCRAVKLLARPGRSLLLRLIPSVLLLYAVLLPAQLSLFPTQNPDFAFRRLFSLAQIFFPLSLLWPMFLYFLPVYGGQSRELLRSLGHPDGGCALIFWLSHQLRALPLYLIYLKLAPSEGRMVLVLIVQSVCVGVWFVCLMTLFRSAMVGMVFLLSYMGLSLLQEQPTLPVLIQNNSLWQDFPPSYFPVRGALLAVALVCLWLVRKGGGLQLQKRFGAGR